MLLVDHREPEIGERDALLDQRMGADGDVDFALRQFGERGAARRSPVPAGDEPDPQADRFSERRQPVIVLAGEDFGRRHHRRLASRFDHVRHRHQRDDGLARSDVALEEPQHPLLGPEIGADVVDRLPLRFCQRKRQRGLEAAPQCPFGAVRAAGNGPHPRPHEQERELVGEQFVIGETGRRRTGRVDVLGPRRLVHRGQRRGEAGQVEPAHGFVADPFRQPRQALERGLGRAGDSARVEALGQAVDRLDRGQAGELLGVHHPVGMDDLPPAVPKLELAGDPARRAPIGSFERTHSWLARKKTSSTSPVSSSTSTLNGARERALPGSRCSVTVASMVTIVSGTASRIFGRARRSTVDCGRWKRTSTTRAPCGLSSRRSNSFAFFGPIPGKALAAAKSGSRRDGRTRAL